MLSMLCNTQGSLAALGHLGLLNPENVIKTATPVNQRADNLIKLSARIPVIHGTSGRWSALKAAVRSKINPTDPNPQLIYMATAGRARKKGVENFARSAAESGGVPVIALAKIDTAEGWLPHQLTAWGKKEIGSPLEAADLVRELDTLPKGSPARGQLWQTIQRGIGSWKHPDPNFELPIRKYRDVLP
jgi:hypothetical protein